MDEEGRVYLDKEAPPEDIERLRRAIASDRVDLTERIETLERQVEEILRSRVNDEDHFHHRQQLEDDRNRPDES